MKTISQLPESGHCLLNSVLQCHHHIFCLRHSCLQVLQNIIEEVYCRNDLFYQLLVVLFSLQGLSQGIDLCLILYRLHLHFLLIRAWDALIHLFLLILRFSYLPVIELSQ